MMIHLLYGVSSMKTPKKRKRRHRKQNRRVAVKSSVESALNASILCFIRRQSCIERYCRIWQATIFLISQHNLPFFIWFVIQSLCEFFVKGKYSDFQLSSCKNPIRLNRGFFCFVSRMHVYLCVDNFFHICLWTSFSSILFTYNSTHRLIEV